MAEEKRLGLIEHLDELRSRLIVALVAILVTTALAYIFSDTLIFILRLPAGDIKLRAFSPMDGFLIRFRVAVYGGVFLAAPVWIFEVLRFLSPGLLPRERKFIFPGVVAMLGLFALGNVFGYLMLQNMFSVLFTMFGTELEYFPSADQYISFVTYFLIATGLAFELPIILLLAIKIGFVSIDQVKRQRRVAYFALFVFAELITPVADPIIAPTVVMIPMLVLFELALFIARFIAPKPTTATLPAETNATS
ncbi:MAG: twin-arginine translocase subunit TatC [Chloroflexi bacterium]|nr:twin-arginine translocase subunit TatC [Chloroflexota bacterium]